MTESTRGIEVVAMLREQIWSGVYPPGAHLSEYALAARLGVSRTPIRNALAALQLEDLVVYREHRGFVVRHLTYHEIQARLRVRATLEGLAARIVAGNGLSDADRLQLKGAHQECLDIVAQHPVPRGQDMDRYLVAVDRYYQCLRQATDNPLLIETIERALRFPISTKAGVRWVEHESYVTRQIPALIVANANLDRSRILDAIAEGNGVRAETLTREHMFTISQGLDKLARQFVAD